MIIFHIPSWYPSHLHPYSGVFIKEYIEGYASQYPDSLNIVSNHLHNYYPVSLSNPVDTLSEIKKFITARKNTENKTADNIIELPAPKILGLSPVLFPYKLNELKRYHSNNLDLTIKKYGKPDLIHCYVSFPSSMIGYTLSGKFNIPYIITEHLGPFLPPVLTKNKKILRGLEKALQHASAVISVSNSHANQVQKIAKRNVDVIPNIINENLFYPPDASTGKNENFTFLTVASTMHNSKGIDTLIKAIQLFNKNGMKAHFRIGGSNKFQAEAVSLARELGVYNISWFDHLTRKEISEEMRKCDAFVLASRQESFGVVYAEAIASGKPVIATSCGGPEDIVNEMNGLLIPVGNFTMLAAAMKELIDHKDKYDQEVIRKDFMKRFSRKVVAEKYHSVYRSVSGHH